MKLKYPTQRLVARKQAEIRAWREEGASWEAIAEALEKDTQWQEEGRPAALPNSIRKAWSKFSQEIPGIPRISRDKPLASPVDARIVPENTKPPQANRISQEFLGNSGNSQDNSPPTRANQQFPPVPTNEEYELLPMADKLKWGKPATTPDGRRIWTPLSDHEIKMLEVWDRHERCDSGEL